MFKKFFSKKPAIKITSTKKHGWRTIVIKGWPEVFIIFFMIIFVIQLLMLIILNMKS